MPLENLIHKMASESLLENKVGKRGAFRLLKFIKMKVRDSERQRSYIRSWFAIPVCNSRQIFVGMEMRFDEITSCLSADDHLSYAKQRSEESSFLESRWPFSSSFHVCNVEFLPLQRDCPLARKICPALLSVMLTLCFQVCKQPS